MSDMLISFDWLKHHATNTPDKMAIGVWRTKTNFSFKDLNAMADQYASLLYHEMGIQAGDRVAVLSAYNEKYVALFAVTQKLGIILVPLNYRATNAEITDVLSSSQPILIIAAEQFGRLLEPNTFKTWGEMEALLASANNCHEIPKYKPIGIAMLLFTSGSTGTPKGVKYTHEMAWWNSENTRLALSTDDESITVNCMPPFHTGGWNVLLTPLLCQGGYTMLMESFDATEVLNALQLTKSTLFMAVPTMCRILTATPSFSEIDLSHLKYLIVGGEPMPQDLIQIFHARNIPVRQGYGMTEAGPNLTSLHQLDSITKAGSIGKPNRYVELKAINEHGEEAIHEESGELCIKGPIVTPGYWGQEQLTDEAIQDGWLHTGDVALQDYEGFWYIVDRIKNMYISGGENVYPSEIEKILLLRAEIHQVAIKGIPDVQWGEIGCAWIVLEEGKTFDQEDCVLWLKTLVTGYKIPKKWVVIDSIPLNAAGKVDKNKLMA